MPLTVQVISYKNQPLQEPLSASFDREEGTLGRSSENHFILPDPEKFVSHIHAIISYEHGCYYLKDTSANGTLVSNKNSRIHRESIQLEDGDRLKIGDYDLVVSITERFAVATNRHKVYKGSSLPGTVPGTPAKL